MRPASSQAGLGRTLSSFAGALAYARLTPIISSSLPAGDPGNTPAKQQSDMPKISQEVMDGRTL